MKDKYSLVYSILEAVDNRAEDVQPELDADVRNIVFENLSQIYPNRVELYKILINFSEKLEDKSDVRIESFVDNYIDSIFTQQTAYDEEEDQPTFFNH